jgi:hypothetical protein
MRDWKLPWRGGCRCGQTTIEVSKPPLMASACHCTGCQKMTSSAFSLTLSLPADGFAVTSGEPVIGGLHGGTRHYFCSHCLSWMFTRPEGYDFFVNLRASVLDDHSWFEPYIEVWVNEKLPWTSTPAAHRYATQPEVTAYEGLIGEYQERGAGPV